MIAKGSVTASQNSYGNVSAGGLVGQNNGTITGCFSIGNVTVRNNSSEGNGSGRAGGIVGVNNYPNGSVSGCYRYSGQCFSINKNGSTSTIATNTYGTSQNISTLQSVSFHVSTLGWLTDDWNFIEGEYPTLKNVGTIN